MTNTTTKTVSKALQAAIDAEAKLKAIARVRRPTQEETDEALRAYAAAAAEVRK